MNILIDWISFTIPVEWPAGMFPSHWQKVALAAIDDHCGYEWSSYLARKEWRGRNGRAPYSVGFESIPAGFYYFANPGAVETVLFELSGYGCAVAREDKVLHRLLQCASARLTRLDIAVDIKTPVSPVEFAENRATGRFRAQSVMQSDRGTTVYVGSPKSDRYARVYRFNDPHPRSDYLRVEMVMRKDQAKATGVAVVNSGLVKTGALLGNVFGWKHELWNPPVITDDKLPGLRPAHNRDAQTLVWIISQCAPAFRRLVESGEIENPKEFIERYFLP